ncbi:MAG: polysaccharide biosynthesis tyrosine autokinase [Solirubrobacteraceae bacterium]
MSAEHLLRILWERKLSFLLTFLVTLGTAAAVTFSLPKIYETSAYLYISAGEQSSSDFEQVQTNQVITKTIAELLQTQNVAQAAADRLPFASSGTELLQTVEIAAIAQSQLITVTASGSTPERAQRIANTYAGAFVALQSELLAIPSVSRQVRVAASAPLITDPSRPKPRLYLLIGGLVAVFTAVGAALVSDRTDKRLRLDAFTTELEGLPVIGRIPRVPASSIQAAVVDGNRPVPARQLDEAYRLVLANLAFVNAGHRPRSLAVVSAGPSEGKSTACVSLALGAAELGLDVLLADGDLRRPRVASLVSGGMDHSLPGFSGLLVESSRTLFESVEDVEGTSLSMLRAGTLPPNPAALLASPRLADFVASSSQTFDLTILDTPPIAIGADASLIASVTEGVILVIDTRTISRTALHRAVDQLRRSRANLLGIVLNQVDDTPSYGYNTAETPAAPRRARRKKSRSTAVESRDSS